MAQHALVIGIDGLRHDHVGAELTPCLRDLAAAGFLSPVLIDEQTPTWSGPCWATIATGVTVAEHAIMHNDFTGHRLAEHPDFLTIATRAGLATFLAVSGWPPLALAENGGPLFADVTRREFVAPDDEHSAAAWDTTDEAVTVLTEKVLAEEAPELSFVYLGAVDVTGHTAGAGTAYREAARAADRRLGRLVATVNARPDADAWTIVAVTDHGHLDGGGHGGREPEVATAWAAGRGPGLSPLAPSPVTRHTDIAPLVLRTVLS